MIGLTMRYKTDDQLWFTFFHEVAHILLHRDRKSFVVDNAVDHMGDGVVDPGMARYEEADKFAADTLIPPNSLTDFLDNHGSTPTSIEIRDFAAEIEIGPGIVVGRLQHDEVLKHWQGNAFKQRLDWEFVTED